MAKKIQIVVESHPDGFVAYAVGLSGVVVGEGDSYEEAVADLRSAIEFHAETFGEEVEIVELDIFGDHSLKGSVLRYDDPTEPVAVEDWEVLAD